MSEEIGKIKNGFLFKKTFLKRNPKCLGLNELRDWKIKNNEFLRKHP